MVVNTWKSFCFFSFFRLALDPMIAGAIAIAIEMLKLHRAFFL